MFKTFVGPVEDEGAVAYPAPGNCAGPFRQFCQCPADRAPEAPFWHGSGWQVVPQRDHSGNFVFRTREFEQMELEYYVPPDDAQRWFEYWCNERYEWYVRLGIPREMLRLRHHSKRTVALFAGNGRCRVRPSPGLGELEGMPTGLISTSRPIRQRVARCSSISTPPPRALRALCDRACRWRRPAR